MITEAAQESTTFFPPRSELVAGTFYFQKLQGDFVTGFSAVEMEPREVPSEVVQHEGPSVLVACGLQPRGIRSYSNDHRVEEVAVREGEDRHVSVWDRLGGCTPHQVQTPPANSEFISGYLNNNFFKAQQETNGSVHRVLALRHYELHLYPYDGNSRAAHLETKSELVTGK